MLRVLLMTSLLAFGVPLVAGTGSTELLNAALGSSCKKCDENACYVGVGIGKSAVRLLMSITL